MDVESANRAPVRTNSDKENLSKKGHSKTEKRGKGRREVNEPERRRTARLANKIWDT